MVDREDGERRVPRGGWGVLEDLVTKDRRPVGRKTVGMEVLAYNPSTKETDARRSQVLGPYRKSFTLSRDNPVCS